jgi:hypothetical protein
MKNTAMSDSKKQWIDENAHEAVGRFVSLNVSVDCVERLAVPCSMGNASYYIHKGSRPHPSIYPPFVPCRLRQAAPGILRRLRIISADPIGMTCLSHRDRGLPVLSHWPRGLG